MPRNVLLTEDAQRDLEEIYDYVAKRDSPKSADHILDRVLDVIQSLAAHPERGSLPRELRSLGNHRYRQLSFKPYRLIYRITGDDVIIYVIVDGRRDMQSLLQRRLLGG